MTDRLTFEHGALPWAIDLLCRVHLRDIESDDGWLVEMHTPSTLHAALLDDYVEAWRVMRRYLMDGRRGRK